MIGGDPGRIGIGDSMLVGTCGIKRNSGVGRDGGIGEIGGIGCRTGIKIVIGGWDGGIGEIKSRMGSGKFPSLISSEILN